MTINSTCSDIDISVWNRRMKNVIFLWAMSMILCQNNDRKNETIYILKFSARIFCFEHGNVLHCMRAVRNKEPASLEQLQDRKINSNILSTCGRVFVMKLLWLKHCHVQKMRYDDSVLCARRFGCLP